MRERMVVTILSVRKLRGDIRGHLRVKSDRASDALGDQNEPNQRAVTFRSFPRKLAQRDVYFLGGLYAADQTSHQFFVPRWSGSVHRRRARYAGL